jgi:hypothetical protein
LWSGSRCRPWVYTLSSSPSTVKQKTIELLLKPTGGSVVHWVRRNPALGGSRPGSCPGPLADSCVNYAMSFLLPVQGS